MAKRNQKSNFPQTFPARPLVKTRTAQPIPMPTKNGIELRCPFCSDHHVIFPNVESPCGTRIEVTAVQEVISKSLVRKENLTCIKCFKSGGEMVRYRNSFIHAEECNPEARLLQDIPPNNRLAQFVFGLPDWAKKGIEKFTGPASIVHEIDNDGHKTGKIAAYLFWKGQNGKHPAAST